MARTLDDERLPDAPCLWGLLRTAHHFDGDVIDAYNGASSGPEMEALGPLHELETSLPGRHRG